ncbi:hypothetical protein UFOVP1382_138 [uncultured Caudovirales phage]|uniref:Uncharacterized protein n=1 Tax=uncultured Caudovirales phage TaxID=2100421 RepID=A0A6J5S4J9_9CAUD|nr:hypothetical protein UFOVP1382_138 [uncultured Caudovirales phage]
MSLTHPTAAELAEIFSHSKPYNGTSKLTPVLQRICADIDVVAQASGADRLTKFALADDFCGASLPSWLTSQDTSAAGAPTIAVVADALGGQWTLTHAATDEVENIGLNGNNNQYVKVPAAAGEIAAFEARVKISAQLTAAERVVIGLASDRAADLDTIVTNAWIRAEGANLNLYWETDDGTTDDDDNDTHVDYVADTFFVVRIEVHFGGAVKFFVNGAPCGTGSIAATASAGLQPFIEFQKDSGTTTKYVRIDWLALTAPR